MLRELHIKNYAIIDEVSLTLSEGFNVITGETGAGKSILVEALSLILGERSSLEGVRHGANEAVLEAAFDPPSSSSEVNPSKELSHTNELDPADDLIFKRVLNKSGKNRTYLNGSMATLSALKQAGQKLVEIHGQQGQQLLTDLDQQGLLLDAFCRLSDERFRFASDFRHWSDLRRRLESLEKQGAEALRKRSLLEEQVSEIREANLSVDEEKQLEQEEHTLKNWEAILSMSQGAYALLSDEGGLLQQLDVCGTEIRDLNGITDDAAAELELWEQAKIHLKELTTFLRTRCHDAEYQPERLETVSARLYQIQTLKKKYQRSLEELIDYQQDLENELSGFFENETRQGELADLIKTAEKALGSAAQRLSEKRAEGRVRLATQVKEALNTLGMEKTSFVIAQEKVPLSETGIDQIEFLIALPGETPQSLGKIASGGELSRIMLAVKVVLAGVDPVDTLVFDEIDAGVGGGIAERIGRRLSKLAENHQVLCITHLPQIASLADHHYFVEKNVSVDHVSTSIRALNRKDRVEELARMLGGVNITDLTRRHAEEMMRAK